LTSKKGGRGRTGGGKNKTISRRKAMEMVFCQCKTTVKTTRGFVGEIWRIFKIEEEVGTERISAAQKGNQRKEKKKRI